MDSQSHGDSTPVADVRGEAGDGHGAVDAHLVLLAVLGYVENIWRELRQEVRV